MRVLFLTLALPLLATACTSQTPQEKAASDARDIAMVEAIQKQKPPPQAITPLPIDFAAIEKHDLFGSGCAFIPPGGRDPLALTQHEAAFILLDSGLVRFASDLGSTSMPFDTVSHYDAKNYVLNIAKAAGEGTQSGSETRDWPGTLEVRDAYDQPVYRARGTVQCGS